MTLPTGEAARWWVAKMAIRLETRTADAGGVLSQERRRSLTLQRKLRIAIEHKTEKAEKLRRKIAALAYRDGGGDEFGGRRSRRLRLGRVALQLESTPMDHGAPAACTPAAAATPTRPTRSPASARRGRVGGASMARRQWEALIRSGAPAQTVR